MNERIQKLLADAGVASRREAERWIAEGRVTVNGVKAQLGDRAGREDVVRVDGRTIKLAEAGRTRRVLAYNKPVGEVCTRHYPAGRPDPHPRPPANHQTPALLAIPSSGRIHGYRAGRHYGQRTTGSAPG